MFRFASGRRRHLPLPARPTRSPRFEGHPYLVSRIGRCALRHIALVPADWPRERVVALARAQARANHLETAACFGPDDAVYVDAGGDQDWDGPSPSGIYVIERLHLAEPVPESEELAARRALLHAFEQARRPAGYVVGDGTERGRRARPEDRGRLAGRGPGGLPAGLHRCERCGHAAGAALRDEVEVVRVSCACDNHNRCARCLLPIAEHRLSAWHWDEEAGAARHLAAYAAFSHRCPDESTT